MIQNLAQWYTLAKLKGPDPDKLKSRVTSIDSIIKKKTIEFFLECTRLFLGKKLTNQEFKTELTNLFAADDPYFQTTKNDLELRILAGAIMWSHALSPKAKDKFHCLQAFRTGLFAGSESKYINPDIIEGVLRALNEESISSRESIKNEQFKVTIDPALGAIDTVAIGAKFTSVNEAFGKIATYINSTINKRISLIEEESNIHWWIFRGFSNVKGRRFAEIDALEMPFALAIDLLNLTKVVPGPYPAEQFILKILADAKNDGKTVSISDFVNNIPSEQRSTYFPEPGIFSNLLPLTFAVSKAMQSEGNASWAVPFETECGIKASAKFNPATLAVQLYNELLTVKYFGAK